MHSQCALQAQGVAGYPYPWEQELSAAKQRRLGALQGVLLRMLSRDRSKRPPAEALWQALLAQFHLGA